MNSIRSELNSLVISEFRSRKSSPAGLFSIFANISLAVLSALLCEVLIAQFPASAFSMRILTIFFIGTRWRALGNMMHECAHGIFVDKARHNTFFGHLLSVFELCSFRDYVEQHVSHHAYLGNPEKDLDYKSRRVFLSASPTQSTRLLQVFLMCITLIPLWLQLLRPTLWLKTCPLWTNILRTILIGSVGTLCSVSTTRELTILYVLVPYLTAYQWMKIFSDLVDHLFLYDREDPLDRSRNHLLPGAFLNWVLFPRNDAYHLLHHLFPSLPTHQYPKTHQLLLTHPWYARKAHKLWGNERDAYALDAVLRPK